MSAQSLPCIRVGFRSSLNTLALASTAWKALEEAQGVRDEIEYLAFARGLREALQRASALARA